MKSWFLIAGFFLFCGFRQPPEKGWETKAHAPENIHRAIQEITDVMVHDIYSPPVASRTYAYISVAGYEAARHTNPSYQTLAGQLSGLAPPPQPHPGSRYAFPVAAMTAILTVGRELVISEARVDLLQNRLLQELKRAGMPQAIFDSSVQYGKRVGRHILAWASTDRYKQTRSMPKFDLADDEAVWRPTPPAYLKAVEPHWNQVRPFLMDSAQQFKPETAVAFSNQPSSAFHLLAKEVYDVTKSLTEEQKAIANFWDCNPFKMNIKGHVMFATKKISPGGHWINITALACRKINADAARAAEAYACVALAIADGFISCWDEKYRSQTIRPETYINQYIDPAWTPLLQTPPFPEYPSGHSVVSGIAATMLTQLFGDNFAFTDITEEQFGLPARHFKSFEQAAQEAAISRLYGGIHYRPAINNGLAEGKQIGAFYTRRLQTRKTSKPA